jgi:hypothetical protein
MVGRKLEADDALVAWRHQVAHHPLATLHVALPIHMGGMGKAVANVILVVIEEEAHVEADMLLARHLLARLVSSAACRSLPKTAR